MIDLDKYIDAFIHDEKKITPSPFLQSRIMASINTENATQRVSIWQSLAVAASIAAAIVSGFYIGNSYNYSSKGNNYMVINDSQIENLVILTNNAEE